MSRLPTLFIPHGGGPCFFMNLDRPDTWHRMAEYLRRVPEDVGERPKALVVVSGHWEEKVVTIQNNTGPPLLYDYYRFPESTYQITFPSAGSAGDCRKDFRIAHGCGHQVYIRPFPWL